MDGAYYWLSCTGPTVVLLDMSKEMFREVELPPCFNQNSKLLLMHLICCEDESVRLLVVINWLINSIGLWVMKGEGVLDQTFQIWAIPQYRLPS